KNIEQILFYFAHGHALVGDFAKLQTLAWLAAPRRDPTLLIFNIIHRRKHHSAVGSRLGATR
ncbi:MAG: hypothetical protein PT955_04300, partial [Bacteroidales bacterium]|nr:hypothetical protein [Bacteroidales bacterium]